MRISTKDIDTLKGLKKLFDCNKKKRKSSQQTTALSQQEKQLRLNNMVYGRPRFSNVENLETELMRERLRGAQYNLNRPLYDNNNVAYNSVNAKLSAVRPQNNYLFDANNDVHFRSYKNKDVGTDAYSQTEPFTEDIDTSFDQWRYGFVNEIDERHQMEKEDKNVNDDVFNTPMSQKKNNDDIFGTPQSDYGRRLNTNLYEHLSPYQDEPTQRHFMNNKKEFKAHYTNDIEQANQMKDFYYPNDLNTLKKKRLREMYNNIYGADADENIIRRGDVALLKHKIYLKMMENNEVVDNAKTKKKKKNK